MWTQTQGRSFSLTGARDHLFLPPPPSPVDLGIALQGAGEPSSLPGQQCVQPCPLISAQTSWDVIGALSSENPSLRNGGLGQQLPTASDTCSPRDVMP